MVRCAKGALYTGIATDVGVRVRRHNAGTGAKSVKALGLPVTLVYFVTKSSKSEALKLEYAIKQLPRKKKLELIGSTENEYKPEKLHVR
jgi:putative endonuclease